MIALLITIFLFDAPQGGPAPEWRQRYSFESCDESSGWALGQYAVSADAAKLVMRRDERRREPRAAPWRHELVYVDLQTGKEIAPHEIPFSTTTPLGVSSDGSVVACLRQVGGSQQEPYRLSLWKPLEDPTTLKDYADFTISRTPERVDLVVATGVDGLGISPDGSKVAFFGEERIGPPAADYESRRDVVAIVELATGRVTAVPIPVKTSATLPRYWKLAWRGDGAQVYVILHGDYDAWSSTGRSGVRAVTAALPELTLYLVSVDDRTITRVASTPLQVLGFDGDDNLIVADRSSNGEATGFRRIAIGQLGGLTVQKAVAPPAERVVPASEVREIDVTAVFAGRRRTYAGVYERTKDSGCQVILEKPSSER